MNKVACNNLPNSRGCSGMTLTEVMVALTLGLILMGAVLGIYSGTKQSYRLQHALARLQENGIFAIEFLSRDLRMSGYQGCASLSFVQPPDASLTVAGESVNLSLSPATALRGYRVMDDSGTVSPTYSGPGSQPEYDVPGTDAISMIFGACEAELTADMGTGTAATVESNSCGFQEDDILIISDCIKSNVFVADSGTTSTNIDTGGVSGYGVGAKVLKLKIRDYYLKNKILADGTDIPSLYRRDRNADSSTEEEVIEGVEDIDLRFGVRDPVSGVMNFSTADNVTDWGQVKLVRVRLLLQTQEDHLAERSQVYKFAGGSFTAADRRVRREFSTTVNLRNLSLK